MQSTVTRLLKEFIQNGVMIVGLVAWVFYLNWKWALMAFLIFPFVILPVASIGRKLKRLSHKGQEVMADLCSTVVESFSGIKVVRAFGLEPDENRKFIDLSQAHLQVMKKNVKYAEIISPVMEILSVISASIILWYGGQKVLTDEVTQGTFIAFIVGLFMIYGPLRVLVKNWGNLQISLAGAERVFSILDMDKERVTEGDKNLPGFQDRIEFKDLCFKYPTRRTMVLNQIQLSIRKGQVLAIVGMSGAGKTTLVDLLFRFFDPSNGGIYIDGINIKDYRLKSLRDNLALVTQETFLFNDTIWNNIAFGKAEATREEVLSAAKAANVDFFVQHLDDGYETMIGERGVKLSGGQRQRIAIARAILRNAPILVLDEATSSLDSESEKLVQGALQNLMAERTTFVIAHRLSTVKHADRIIVLDKGEIVESGTHEELLVKSGLYRKYHDMQFANVSEADETNS
jgi:subfamily B ATP-binding cassette protein MsbA